MENFDRKKHWENIYENKPLTDVSWYQPTPQTSLDYFKDLNISLDAKIIDIGGGDSFLVDHLLDLGYYNITVLDISNAAVLRAKKRLGSRARQVIFIVSDISDFIPETTYDVWHDRAAFHFLNQKDDVTKYVETARKALKTGGNLIIGTFSESGPLKCSGIEITQYSEHSLSEAFDERFEKISCLAINHPTPFDTVQNFIFCSFWAI